MRGFLSRHGFTFVEGALTSRTRDEWRDWLKSGKIYILKENNKKLHIDGVEYYPIVIQGKGISMSKMGMLFDECYMVDGWFYIFRTEKTRDTVFNWLKKYCQIEIKKTTNDGDECNICMNDDDEECLFIGFRQA